MCKKITNIDILNIALLTLILASVAFNIIKVAIRILLVAE